MPYGFACEEDMRMPVARWLAAGGYRVKHEVRIAGRYCDVVGVAADDVVAVELKLTAWRDALAQAVQYSFGAQHAYVAMPLTKGKAMAAHHDAFRARGVGLLGVAAADGRVETMVEAAASHRYLAFVGDGLMRPSTAERRRQAKYAAFFSVSPAYSSGTESSG